MNECSNTSLNDCDPKNGECIDTLDSYACRCKLGFIDDDPSRPGRKCSNGKLLNLEQVYLFSLSHALFFLDALGTTLAQSFFATRAFS